MDYFIAKFADVNEIKIVTIGTATAYIYNGKRYHT